MFNYLLIFFAIVFGSYSNIKAETLSSALSNAYLSNPIINSKRAELRSLDENVSAATSQFFPSIEAIGSYSENTLEYGELDKIKTNPLTGSFLINQKIFTGGKLINDRLSAINLVAAGRQKLNDSEQSILYQAAQAYFNYLKTEQIVKLQQNNFEVLSERLEATKIQFEVGELTLTDVAQAEARLSQAQSNLADARSLLKAREADYRSIIGLNPDNLEEWNEQLDIPLNEAEAISIALKNNPQLKYYENIERSSDYNVSSQKSMLSPQLSLRGEYIYAEDQSFLMSEDIDQYQITGQIKIPIFYGGLNWSNIRKAQEINSRDKYLIIDGKRKIRSYVKKSFAEYNASKLRISATEKQAQATEIALEGVKQEFQLGTRTTLDILDAEQEYLDARVSFVTAKNDSNTSLFQLFYYLGTLTPENLNMDIKKYDPNKNYKRVRTIKIGPNRIKVIGNVD
ncbi:MAG: TolC family outer membrane protein [Pseudomonadota bacterium]|jgi:outer membrane protein|nr:TolC family outer membrane protein [Pseudomonadota bacterium]